jgi:L-ectoine synthase
VVFRDRADLVGTGRDVHHRDYRTVRLLLEQDPAPVSPTDITLVPGVEDVYGYPDRTEIAYCTSGAAVVVDLDTGTRRTIGPGVLRIAPAGSRSTFLASEPPRLIRVLDPPLRGDETGIVEP